ncbi:MAG: protoporphyrinogen oxidase [Pyrinomonadaceae bacterium]
MSNQTRKRVLIIGGGISGLAAVHRLGELRGDRPIDISLLEAGPRLGGVIRTYERDGFLLEGGPDAFISEKPEALALAQRLGLTDRLISTNEQYRRSFVVRHGKLRSIPDGFHLLAPSRFWPFATSGICSLPAKFRISGELFVPRRKATETEDESLAAFVRRRFGDEALTRLAQPLIGGIYTADPEKLSLRATMPRFLNMEAKHGSVIRALWNQRKDGQQGSGEGTSGARYSLFLSFDRGTQVLSDAVAAHLPSGTVRLNAGVSSVIRSAADPGWLCRLENGETLMADALCLATPARRSAAIVSEFNPELAGELASIPYASSATINLAYRRSDIAHRLNGFGFVVPAVEGRSIIACSFSSVKFAGRAPDGHVLLRAFAGGALQPEIFALDDEEMLRRAILDLTELLGITAPPLFTQIERWANSMPQYHLGHLERVGRIEQLAAAHANFALAGNTFGGAGIPDCIRSGESAAETLLAGITEPAA